MTRLLFYFMVALSRKLAVPSLKVYTFMVPSSIQCREAAGVCGGSVNLVSTYTVPWVHRGTVFLFGLRRSFYGITEV